MGTRTDGYIFFGVMFEDEQEMPWDEHEGGIEDWWREKTGFKSSIEPWDAHGNRKPLVTDKDVEAYFAERDAHDKVHPLPVEEVQCCSYASQKVALAIPSTVISASRGNPIEFTPSNLVHTGQMRKTLESFCEEAGLKYESGPSWWLASFWEV